MRTLMKIVTLLAGQGASAPPTVILSTEAAEPVTETFSVTATFSQDVTDFTSGDVLVTDGVLSNFQTVSASVYTFDVTPASVMVSIVIPAGACQNAAGTDNEASNTLEVTADIADFTDDFNRADGAIGNNWDHEGTWAIVGNVAKNTPNLGSELLTNGNLAAWTGDNPDSFTVIGESGSDPEITERDPNQGHADTKTTGGAANIYSSTSSAIRMTQSVLSVNGWYRLSGDFTNKVGNANMQLRDATAGIFWGASAVGTGKVVTGQAANAAFDLRPSTQPCNITVDNLSAKALTLAELFCKQALLATPGVISVKGTRMANANGHAAWGVVLYVDDNNYLMAFEGQNNQIRLRKRVGGTVTNIANAAITYSAGAVLELDYDKSAKTVTIKYNGSTTTISAQSVTDTVFTTATIAAMFSTAPEVTLEDFATDQPAATPVDVTAPTVALTSDDPVTGAFTVTATFSEAVTGLALGDISVTNGDASNLQTVSASVYTYTITPTAIGAVTSSIAAGACIDAAGNPNSVSNTLDVDYCAPVAEDAGDVATNTTLTQPADGVVEFIVTTIPTSATGNLVSVRQQDASNKWLIRAYSNSGSPFYRLFEVVATVETQRGQSGAGGSLAAGDHIVVRCEDETITILSGAPGSETERINYTSAANFKTETDVVTASNYGGGAISDLKTWGLTCFDAVGSLQYQGVDGWYVSATGNPGAEGNAADPILLLELFNDARLQDGHEIILLDGTHLITETVDVDPSSLTIRAQNPLGATIVISDPTAETETEWTAAATLNMNGGNPQFQDVIIRGNPLSRDTSERFKVGAGTGWLYIGGNNPTDGSGRAAFKRCILHDLESVGNFTASAGGVFAEDTMFFNFGHWAPDTPDGEMWYTQNLAASPNKIMRRCLIGRSYGLGIQIYSTDATKTQNYLIEDVSMLSVLHGYAGVNYYNCTLRRILTWMSAIGIGRLGHTNADIAVVDNYVAGGNLIAGDSEDVTVTGNTLNKIDSKGTINVGTATGTVAVDTNEYNGGVTFQYQSLTKTYTQWQALGFDAAGANNGSLPATNEYFVVASPDGEYVLGQATVYNWEETDEITVDLNALGVSNGQQVKLRSLDDPLVDVRTLTVSGTSVTIDLTTRTVADAIGDDAPPTGSPVLDIRFSAWRVEEVPA